MVLYFLIMSSCVILLLLGAVSPTSFAEDIQSFRSRNNIRKLPIPWAVKHSETAFTTTLDPPLIIKKRRREEDGGGTIEVEVSTPSSEPHVQEIWNRQLTSLRPSTNPTILWIDGHDKVSLQNNKPDIVGYAWGRPKTAFHIVILGDLKEPREKKRSSGAEHFTDTEKGHIVSLLKALFIEQPFRMFAYGFLATESIIQFFLLQYADEKKTDLVLFESAEFYLTPDDASEHPDLVGSNILRGLAAADLSQLGWCVPKLLFKGRPLELSELLGQGGASIVYRGAQGSAEYVVKHYRDGSKALSRLQAEEKNLQQVNSTQFSLHMQFPKLIGSTDCKKGLLVQPVCQHFAWSGRDKSEAMKPNPLGGKQPYLPQASHFAHLVQIAEGLHGRGMIHRDIKPTNFFPDPSDPSKKVSLHVNRKLCHSHSFSQVILNDLGSAVTPATHPIAGTLHCASPGLFLVRIGVFGSHSLLLRCVGSSL